MIAVGATTAILLVNRGNGKPAAASAQPTAEPTAIVCTATPGAYYSPPAVDSGSVEYRARKIADEAGGPAGWPPCHPPAWDGTRMHADYESVCLQGVCAGGYPAGLREWAQRAQSMLGSQVGGDQPGACTSRCDMTFRTDGFTVQVTVRSTHNGGPLTRPGDTLFVAAVTVGQA